MFFLVLQGIDFSTERQVLPSCLGKWLFSVLFSFRSGSGLQKTEPVSCQAIPVELSTVGLLGGGGGIATSRVYGRGGGIATYRVYNGFHGQGANGLIGSIGGGPA